MFICKYIQTFIVSLLVLYIMVSSFNYRFIEFINFVCNRDNEQNFKMYGYWAAEY